jgi:hypothetical protein
MPKLRSRPAALLLFGTLAVAGCATLPAPTPSSTPMPPPQGFVRLVTLSGQLPAGVSASNFACAGYGLADAFLRGDPNAPGEKVWLEPIGPGAGGPRLATWPAGFRARFAPRLELIDASGLVVAREGDRLTKVGGQSRTDGRWQVWEFNGHRYRCY